MGSEIIEIGGFGSILRGGDAAEWVPASFAMPGGGELGLPGARRRGAGAERRLRVSAVPFTRQHDDVQIFDNAKHMYFSTRTFGAPEGGRLTVEWELRARSSAAGRAISTTASCRSTCWTSRAAWR